MYPVSPMTRDDILSEKSIAIVLSYSVFVLIFRYAIQHAIDDEVKDELF